MAKDTKLERASKADLIAKVKESGSLTSDEAKKAVDLVLDGIVSITGENKELVIGKFGKFYRRHSKAMNRRIPGSSGKTVDVPANSNLAYKASKSLKEIY